MSHLRGTLIAPNNNGHRRPRFSRAMVRTINNDALVEAYQRSHIWKALVDAELVEPTAKEKVKGKHQHAVLRAELLHRGFERALVDFEIPDDALAAMVAGDTAGNVVMLTDGEEEI